MPWRESSVVEERLRFVVLASRKERSIAELCREFGISRQTGYTWLKRYAAGGASQVMDRSRRPFHSPGRTRPEMEQRIVKLREQWPDWGAAKLLTILRQQNPEMASIASRTVHRILDRHGLIQASERQRIADQRFERSAPNELWQMDFKGPQGFNKGSPVGPLSVLDDHSRYLIALKHLGSTKMEGVRSTLQEVFQQVGVPEALLVDHGIPWWNGASPWGITELTVWIMQQGIRLTRSGIAHPQTQGKVERMHGALERAVRHRKTNPEDQQWLEIFRHEYNFIRPHEALAMATPSSRWRPSSRRFQPNPPEWKYSPRMQVVRLNGQGQLWWHKQGWEVSNALRRQLVGIEVIGERAIVYFCNTPIRELHMKTGTAWSIPVGVMGLYGTEWERASIAGPFPHPFPLSKRQGCPVSLCQVRPGA
jgi:transposase InsO family protein